MSRTRSSVFDLEDEVADLVFGVKNPVLDVGNLADKVVEPDEVLDTVDEVLDVDEEALTSRTRSLKSAIDLEDMKFSSCLSKVSRERGSPCP